MPVHRFTPLPVAENRGRLIVPAAVASSTLSSLQEFAGSDGRHEGLVYWLGRRDGDDSLVVAAFVPESDHGPQHVFIAEREVGRMSRRARVLGLAVIAQVHSHPGDDTRHSDGDDHLILMPTAGMFSLVIARYGDGAVHPCEGSGLHQYQNRRWVHVKSNCTGALIIVPSILETENE